MREPRAPVPLSVRSYLWMWLGSPGAGSRLGGPPSHSEVCTPQAGVPRGVPSGAPHRGRRGARAWSGRDCGRAESRSRAEPRRVTNSIVTHLLRLTALAKPSPDLLSSALSAEQWGRSGERGQPPAIAASAPAPGLQCFI